MGHTPRARWIIAILAVGALAAAWVGLRMTAGPPASIAYATSGASAATAPLTAVEHEQEEPRLRWIRLIDRAERHALAGAVVLITRADTPPRSFVTASDGIVNAELIDADVLRVEHQGWFPLLASVGALRRKAAGGGILEIPLDHASRLDVLLQDGSASPLPNVFVEVLPIDPGTDKPATELPALWPRSIEFNDSARTDDPFLVRPFTDANGHFVAPVLPRGVPLLVVAHLSASTIEKRVTIPVDQTSFRATLRAP
jgi:hypothetical protein